MGTRLVTNGARVDAARALADALAEGACYVYVADATPGGGAPPELLDSTLETDAGLHQSAIMGKRVTSTDVSLAVRHVPWVSGLSYDAYDDSVDLATRDYYVVVNAGAYSHVWKCLDNNSSNGVTTQQPVFADLGDDDELYELADGYRWLYEYSIASSQVDKFATSDWFPLGSNAQVAAAAVDGAIDQVFVVDGGAGYSNYLTGTLRSEAIQVGNATTYSMAGNALASAIDGYYTGCLMYLSAGTGAGQVRSVSSYFSNSSGRYAVVDSPFSPSPTNLTEFEVYPAVEVRGDGFETRPAIARALVNSVTNAVSRVEMLDRGAGYRQHSAVVVANDVVLVSREAEVRSVYGPPGGHGSDPARELGARAVVTSVTLSNTEHDTVPVDLSFRRIGLVQSPLFSNVTLTVSNTSGTFLEGDVVYVVDSRSTLAGASTNAGSNVVLATSAAAYLRVGDWVYLESSDGEARQVAQVAAVNSTALETTPEALWSCTDVLVMLSDVVAAGHVNAVPDDSHLVVERSTVDVVPGAVLVAAATGARAEVVSVARGGIEDRTYDTFLGLTTLFVDALAGVFETGETLDLSTGAHALCCGTANVVGATATVYVADLRDGPLLPGVAIVGRTSGATAALVVDHEPEIEPASGRVLFVENVQAVTRTSNTAEDLRVVVRF